MTKSLNWTRKAFNRSIQFKGEKGELIGTMTFKILDRDVEAELNGKKYRFDVYGFANKEVAITIIITLKLGKFTWVLEIKQKHNSTMEKSIYGKELISL